MIEFVNIATGERRQLTRPHQIAAFINSSDLHINSNKGQDFGWRLSEELIVQIEEMREDVQKMEEIAKRLGIPADELTSIHLVQQISYEQDLAERMAVKKAERNSTHKKQYEQRIEQLKAADSDEVPVVTPVVSSKPAANKTKKG